MVCLIFFSTIYNPAKKNFIVILWEVKMFLVYTLAIKKPYAILKYLVSALNIHISIKVLKDSILNLLIESKDVISSHFRLCNL